MVSRCVPTSCWQSCFAVSHVKLTELSRCVPCQADRRVSLCPHVKLTELSRCVPMSSWQSCLALPPCQADRAVSLCPQVYRKIPLNYLKLGLDHFFKFIPIICATKSEPKETSHPSLCIFQSYCLNSVFTTLHVTYSVNCNKGTLKNIIKL